jgi:hypothetical protein
MPKGKLSPLEIERLEQWVKIGAPDPRTEPAAGTRDLAIDLD